MFKDKSVLVTGGTGLIGYNLVVRLIKEGCNKIYVTGRNYQKLEATFDSFVDSRLVLFAHNASQPLPNEIKDVDYIFHAAGPMERDVVLNKPVDVILPNIIGTINCMEFLKEQEKTTGKKGRLVVFSSVTVYNNPTNEDYVATENITKYASMLDAQTACYSESKRMVEVIARAYSKQYNVDSVIARFSTVYGYTKNVPNTAFYEFINKAIVGEEIIVNSDAAPRRDNIYVDDAIEGLICIAQKGLTTEAYNISSGGNLGNYAAVDEIAQTVAHIASQGSVVTYKSKGNERMAGLMLNNEKLKKLGWNVHYSLNEGIKETIANFKNNQ